MRKLKIIDLVVMAFLIALEITLTRFCSIQTPFVRIGFGFLPIALCGILYGPIWAGVCYAIGDLLGILIFPTGPFFPGFTLSAFLTGVIYGIVLYKKKITWQRTILAAVLECMIISLFLNTYWLHLLYGKGFLALLPGRLTKAVLMIPVQAFLIRFVWARCAYSFNRILHTRFPDHNSC